MAKAIRLPEKAGEQHALITDLCVWRVNGALSGWKWRAMLEQDALFQPHAGSVTSADPRR